MGFTEYLQGCLSLFFAAVSVCWSLPVLRFFMAAILLAAVVGLVLLLRREVQR